MLLELNGESQSRHEEKDTVLLGLNPVSKPRGEISLPILTQKVAIHSGVQMYGRSSAINAFCGCSVKLAIYHLRKRRANAHWRRPVRAMSAQA